MLEILPKNKQPLISEMAKALASVEGVKAIAIGGSYARGTATQRSDIDLGLYYSEGFPPKLRDLQNLAEQFNCSYDEPLVTNFYEWGPWVNGGVWINTSIGKVDWLFRNLDQVNRVVAEAQKGKFIWDFRQQPPYGFFSVTYLADLQKNIPIHDSQNLLFQLKKETAVFPEKLRDALVQEHLWSIEFTYSSAIKLANQSCIYGVMGCMTRIVAELNQVLFALNRVYFASEREAFKTIETFHMKPKEYSNQIQAILTSPGTGNALIQSLNKLHLIIQEVIQLSKPIYTPKYRIRNL